MRYRHILVLLILATFIPAHLNAQDQFAEKFIRAKVLEVEDMQTADSFPVQGAKLSLNSGEDKGAIISIENILTGNREDLRIRIGQTVILQHITKPDGSDNYSLQEIYRIPSIIWICAIFVLLAGLIGRKRGLMSLLGLIVSVLIISFVIIPLVLKGLDASVVSITGTFLIACSTIIIAHGFNKRSIIALLATCITLLLAIILAYFTVEFASLFGLGSEESIFLKLNSSVQVDPRGLLLAGIIIGALGVLDDITTAQVAVVNEIKKANPTYGFKKLYESGMSVGYEHIASTINTLALAYIGASLPMFLMFYIEQGAPVWVTLNSAFLIEEIIRTIIGSCALLFAAPIATLMAARLYARKT